MKAQKFPMYSRSCELHIHLDFSISFENSIDAPRYSLNVLANGLLFYWAKDKCLHCWARLCFIVSHGMVPKNAIRPWSTGLVFWMWCHWSFTSGICDIVAPSIPKIDVPLKLCQSFLLQRHLASSLQQSFLHLSLWGLFGLSFQIQVGDS